MTTDVDSLLPPNTTILERCLEQVFARIGAVPTPTRDLWNPDTCPVALLPWLAWAWAVDVWDGDWPEATKRAVIKASIAVHKHKGTPYAVKMALSVAGYPNATIREGAGSWLLDGSRVLDGSSYLGDSSKWAWYTVQLAQPIANNQVAQVKAILANVAPARCYLEALDFSAAAFRLDGSVLLDGSYNLGLAT